MSPVPRPSLPGCHILRASLFVLVAWLAACGENVAQLKDPMQGREAATRIGAAKLRGLFGSASRLEHQLEEGAEAEFKRANDGWDPIFKAESPAHWRCRYKVTVRYTPTYVAPVFVTMLIGLDGEARMAPHSSDVRTDQEFFEMLDARAALYKAQGR